MNIGLGLKVWNIDFEINFEKILTFGFITKI